MGMAGIRQAFRIRAAWFLTVMTAWLLALTGAWTTAYLSPVSPETQETTMWASLMMAVSSGKRCWSRSACWTQVLSRVRVPGAAVPGDEGVHGGECLGQDLLPGLQHRAPVPVLKDFLGGGFCEAGHSGVLRRCSGVVVGNWTRLAALHNESFLISIHCAEFVSIRGWLSAALVDAVSGPVVTVSQLAWGWLWRS